MKTWAKWSLGVGVLFGLVAVGTISPTEAALINVAQGKSASQSTTMGSYGAGLAVDGNLNNFTHTVGSSSDANPWWKVDLGGSYLIQSISVENRHDCCQLRLQDTRVQILGADGTTVVWDSGILYPGPITDNNAIPWTTTLNLVALTGGPVRGNWVRLSRTGGNPPGGTDHDRYALSLAEVQVFAGIPTGGTAPGGFARLGASSEVLYYLDAGKGITLNGSQVTQWADQSGRNNHFAQSDANRQPLYQTSGFGGNSMPLLRFDGDNSDPDGAGPLLPGAYSDTLLLNTSTAPRTVFLVNSTSLHRNLDGIWGLNNADTGIRRASSTAWQHPGNANDFTNQGSMYVNGTPGGTVGLNTPHILTGVTSQGFTFGSTNIGNYFIYGHGAGSRAWAGDLAEVLVFNRPLNLAEIRVVENHLSAKYGIPLASGADFYAGDDPAKGDYDRDVFGVGRVDASNKLLEAGSAGFGFQVADGTLNDGEFLMAGHKKAANAWVATDLPPGVRLRWDRVWYVDATGTMDALFAFGFTDGGVSPQVLQPGETYALLYSPTNDFQFTVLQRGEWNGPDQLFFALWGNQIPDGYYTLGIAVPEPASLVLLVLGAAGLLLARCLRRRT